MKQILSAENLNCLKELSRSKTLYVFDYDGTLAPIVQEPRDARIHNMTLGYLKQLSEMVPVAIFSGRSLKDLVPRLPFAAKYIIGNHGVEGPEQTQHLLEKTHETCISWRRFLENDILKEKKIEGVEIEDKAYSIAIHFRRAPDKGKAKLEILNSLSRMSPPARAISGKSVINVVSLSVPHRGAVLSDLISKENAQRALYIGDDSTDEDVFSMNDNRILTIRVGQEETSQANYYIKTQGDINRLLRHLIDYNRHIFSSEASL